MKPKAKLNVGELAQAITDLHGEIMGFNDLESVVLRAHVAIEGYLRLLLAIQKGVGSEELPKLTFAQLAVRTLGDPKREAILEDITRLNRLRNAIAHELGEVRYEGGMWAFARWCRKASGRRRSRWLWLAKERLFRLSKAVLIEILMEMKAKLDDQARSEVRANMAPDTWALFEDPVVGIENLEVNALNIPPLLRSLEEIADLKAAEHAYVNASKRYEIEMLRLVSIHRTVPFDEMRMRELRGLSEQIRDAAARVSSVVRAWRAAQFEQRFHEEYFKLYNLLKVVIAAK